MKIAENLYMLELSTETLGRKGSICPALFWDGQNALLADSGFPGQLPLIKEAMAKEGVPFGNLTALVFTHHDIDHIGTAAEIKKNLPGLEILSHEIEKPYLDGETTPLKLAQMEERKNTLPPEMVSFFERMKEGFKNGRVNVDKTLKDGDEIPFCGGITVIFTPGHTLGHICLYHKNSKTLISGDLLRVTDGELTLPEPRINYDTDQSMESLKKLLPFDIESVICYHGGFYKGEVNKKIKELCK